MQCPYCKLENADAAALCAYCRQPLAAPYNEERTDGIWLIPPTAAAGSGAGFALTAADAEPDADADAEPPAPDAAAGAIGAIDRWLPRLVFFLGIFIVGLGLGVGGTSWFKLSGRAAPATLEDTTEQDDRSRSGERHLRASIAASAASMDRARPPLPDDGAAAASMPAQAAQPPADDDRTVEAPPPAAASAKPRPKRPHRTARDNKQASAASLAASAASSREPLPKRPSRHASGNQAPPPREAPPAAKLQMAENQPASKRFQISQCNSLDSWIEREKCKWRYCSNQWGQHGCPSYPPPRNQQ